MQAKLHSVCESMPLTNTFSTDILSVAHVALTAVAHGCGNAASIQTQIGEIIAHVNGVVHRNRSCEDMETYCALC